VSRNIAVIHTTSPVIPSGALLSVDVSSGDVLASLACPPLGVVTKASSSFDSAESTLACDVLPVGETEAWLLRDEGASTKRPLVVVPHGGPHSCSVTAYNGALAFLAASGYAVLCPNYRGSTGFGARLLNSLPGRCGTQDVEDVVAATEAALARFPDVLDADRVAVVGGSHGGFLGAHLVAQHPELFKCAALRNPVTNVGLMTGVSDIPDWCAVEGGVPASWPAPPSALEALWAKSPVSRIDAISAPVLLAIGLKDRRVPPSQGIDFYHALRARGKPCRMLTYPDDDHALDTPRTAADHWCEIAAFLGEALGEGSSS